MSDIQLICLAIFATVVFGIYNVVPMKYRSIVLLVASYVMYAVVSKLLFACLLVTTLTIWASAYFIGEYNIKFEVYKPNLEKAERKELKAKYNKKKTAIMLAGLIINLLLLVGLKYINFLSGTANSFLSLCNSSFKFAAVKVALPLGISYYTLQAISYLLDVYRGKFKPASLFKVALFIGFFPQLLEGPIGSYDPLGVDLSEGHKYSSKNAFEGFELALWGLIKKIVIADRINIIVSPVFSNYGDYSGLIIALAVVLFTFELYAEFSGIIELVTGIAMMYGIRLAKNFNQPFFSLTVSEFWRRWHISLGAWFRDYVFYPISTSRWFAKLNKSIRGKVWKIFETFIPLFVSLLPVWLLTGLWHGASWKYVVYGLYYFAIMMVGVFVKPVEQKLFRVNEDKPQLWFKIFAIARTFVLVNIGMLIFRAVDLSTAWGMIAGLFHSGETLIITTSTTTGIIDLADFIMIIIGVAALLIVDAIKEKGINIGEVVAKRDVFVQLTLCVVMMFGLMIFGAYGNGYLPVDPIYGGF